jgi:hypothetical protein
MPVSPEPMIVDFLFFFMMVFFVDPVKKPLSWQITTEYL